MNSELRAALEPVVERYRRLQLWRGLALCFAAAALVAFALVGLRSITGWTLPYAFPIWSTLTLLTAFEIRWRVKRIEPDIRWVARQIEARHPELSALLLTAVEQEMLEGKAFGFLQRRLVQQAVEAARQSNWMDAIDIRQLRLAQLACAASVVLFATPMVGLQVSERRARVSRELLDSVVVTPGDTSIERGNSLVVLARFTGQLPAGVNLVIGATPESSRSVALVKSLDDPVFGGSVAEMTGDLLYHVEYAGQRTRDFKVTVFEHPRLERSDATIRYPQYTELPEKRIENTRRISAVEGSKLDLALQLNKPVTSARLVAKDKSVIPLIVETNKAAVLLRDFPMALSKSYELQLVDSEGRTNKLPTQFVFEALKNRPPELKLASPRGDQRVSSLEEISFQGEAWDDFGVRAYGLAYTIAGQETKYVKLGDSVPGREKRPFNYLLPLESLKVQPDQLVSYFTWAEDIGPDGQPRRTSSDMFFAEVRPFEEIFRQGQSQDQQGQAGGQQSGGGGPTTKLAELQKQIINATWKLQRQETAKTPSAQYVKDIPVVVESQEQALEQAQALQEKVSGTEGLANVDKIIVQMNKAVARLNEATNSAAPLPLALAAEQSAYQALLKLAGREKTVQRGQGGGGGGQSAQERQQLDNLDLAEEKNRYETQKQAMPQKSTEQREQLQVLNRLKELAQRQQDLNERLKELQTALQEAKTEQEREDVQRRLKRLREEEQQMLADVDELKQRMEKPENQAGMSEQRDQLDKTRDQVKQAGEAMDKGAVQQALSSGTRAQRDLQAMRDDLRKKNSSQFAEEMRQMRADAREMAQKQEDIGKRLDSMADNQKRTLTDSDERKELATQLVEQQARMTNLLNQASQVSEQAETVEPLLSKQLYDTIRKQSQTDAKNWKDTANTLIQKGLLPESVYERFQKSDENGKPLALTAELVRQSWVKPGEASAVEQVARGEIDELKRGVEHAAESVLGDEAESLKQARKEVDVLTEELNKELAKADPELAKAIAAAEGAAKDGKAGSKSENGGEDGKSSTRMARAGKESGKSGPDGETGQGKQAGKTGEEGQPADGAQASQGESQGGGKGGQSGKQGGKEGQAPSDGQGQGGGGAQGGRDAASANRSLAGRRGPAGELNQAGGANNGGGGYNGGYNGGGGYYDRTRGIWLNGGVWADGPFTGTNFVQWSDRLRDVEEMVDLPDLRNQIARIREDARQIRRAVREESQKPDWAVVRTKISGPLVEVRQRLDEELAKRESKDSLVPLDRDPVPGRFSDLVRRYYQELGRDEASNRPAPK